MELHKGLGAKIRELRKEKKFTLRQVGEQTGMDHSYIGRIERGEITSPSLDTLQKIAEVLEVDISTFFGEKGQVPDELKEIGVEWIRFAKEMKQRELTPEQVKVFIKFVDDMGLGKK